MWKHLQNPGQTRTPVLSENLNLYFWSTPSQFYVTKISNCLKFCEFFNELYISGRTISKIWLISKDWLYYYQASTAPSRLPPPPSLRHGSRIYSYWVWRAFQWPPTKYLLIRLGGLFRYQFQFQKRYIHFFLFVWSTNKANKQTICQLYLLCIHFALCAYSCSGLVNEMEISILTDWWEIGLIFVFAKCMKYTRNWWFLRIRIVLKWWKEASLYWLYS